MDVQVIETSSLGDRSYLAHDGRVALVVDPQRDIDRVLALAGRLGVRITHVAAGRADLPAPEVVLDVRMNNEWRGGHLDGAVHIPLPDLPQRLHDVPPGTVWVHCGSGYRAAAATGLLQRAPAAGSCTSTTPTTTPIPGRRLRPSPTRATRCADATNVRCPGCRG